MNVADLIEGGALASGRKHSVEDDASGEKKEKQGTSIRCRIGGHCGSWTFLILKWAVGSWDALVCV